jgi:hypothetical protein
MKFLSKSVHSSLKVILEIHFIVEGKKIIEKRAKNYATIFIEISMEIKKFIFEHNFI